VLSAVVGFPLLRDMAAALGDYLDAMQKAAAGGGQVPTFQLYSDLMADQRYVGAATGFTVIQIVLSAIYHTSMIALRGATLGKLATGVRVRPWDVDGRPGWGPAVLRWAATDIGSVIPVVGVAYTLLDRVWLLRDPRRQCLHDKLPKTCVVRSR
jgi:uncharacterized RDD family membrane protein YckC